MITMMEHPKHGRHPANGHEVEPMKLQGWTVCAPKAKAAPVEPEPPVESAPEAPRQKRPYNRRQA